MSAFLLLKGALYRFFDFGKRRAVPIALIALIIFCHTASSCSGECDDCGSLMLSFASDMKIGGSIYSYSFAEGEGGYIRRGFFDELFGEGEELVDDFAYLSASTTMSVTECTLILCRNEYDTIAVAELCLTRVRLMDSLVDAPLSEQSFVIKSGRRVVMGIMLEAKEGKNLWSKMLR